MPESTRVLDAARHRRQSQKVRAPSPEACAVIGDGYHPIGIKQCGRSGAFDQADGCRHRIARQPRIDPAIGARHSLLDAPLHFGRDGSVPDRIVDTVLHRVHHVIVEHPVDHARPDRLVCVGREKRRGTGMVKRKILDDRSRFEHLARSIHQQRKFAHRAGLLDPVMGSCLIGVLAIETVERERRAIERDQRLPCVGREGMAVEREHQASPRAAASIAA